MGALVGKATRPREALFYPLTTVPLSLASPDSDLRQGCKAALPNFPIKESIAEVQTHLSEAAWLIDDLAAFRSVKSTPSGESMQRHTSDYARLQLHIKHIQLL